MKPFPIDLDALPPRFFVCGTDTAVGKTFVSTLLLTHLNDLGIRAGGFKPFESGPIKGGDSSLLKKAGKMPEPLSLINPFHFKLPLAPAVAAQLEKKKIKWNVLSRAFSRLAQNYEVLLVEGAGGLLVPLTDKKNNVDLIRFLKLPVLLVGRLGLGTLNHTLLTLDVLRRNQIEVCGVILNQTTPQRGLAEKTNPGVLKKAGVPLWGVVPFYKKTPMA